MLGGTFKLDTVASFHILCYSSFTNFPAVQHYVPNRVKEKCKKKFFISEVTFDERRQLRRFNSMDQSPSWVATNSSDFQEILCSLFHVTLKFINVFTTARHWTQSRVLYIRSISSHSIYLIHILILSRPR
jgi:hypothetical protein